MDKEVWKLLKYHYRRAGIGRENREFRVILERKGIKVQVGEVVGEEGTFHTPKMIIGLIAKGWRLVAVESCFRWAWEARRYVGYDRERQSGVDYDVYGKPYITVLYSGYHDIIDVFDENGKQKRYSAKYWFCHHTSEETTRFDNIPKEISNMFYKVDWLM